MSRDERDSGRAPRRRASAHEAARRRARRLCAPRRPHRGPHGNGYLPGRPLRDARGGLRPAGDALAVPGPREDHHRREPTRGGASALPAARIDQLPAGPARGAARLGGRHAEAPLLHARAPARAGPRWRSVPDRARASATVHLEGRCGATLRALGGAGRCPIPAGAAAGALPAHHRRGVCRAARRPPATEAAS